MNGHDAFGMTTIGKALTDGEVYNEVSAKATKPGILNALGRRRASKWVAKNPQYKGSSKETIR